MIELIVLQSIYKTRGACTFTMKGAYEAMHLDKEEILNLAAAWKKAWLWENREKWKGHVLM